jgi:hypothetical protein
VSAKPIPYVCGWCAYAPDHLRCYGDPCTCTHEPETVEAPVLTLVETAPAADLGDSLALLERGVAGLDTALLGFDGSAIELLDLLGIVRDHRKNLADIESLLETRAAKAMTGDVMEWTGGTAERRWGKDRKEWKHDALTSAVTAAIVPPLAVDPNGEVDTVLAELLHEAISAYAATNRPSWRVTAVKPLGIDPDEFCTSSPGRPSVTVTRKDTA